MCLCAEYFLFAAVPVVQGGRPAAGRGPVRRDHQRPGRKQTLRRLRGGQVGIVLQNPMTCFDPLYRVGDQIAESFAAHNSWSGEEIRRRSLELLEKMRIRSPEEVLEMFRDAEICVGELEERLILGDVVYGD